MSSEEKQSPEKNQQWLPVFLIAGALAIWGGLLAVGAWLAPGGDEASRHGRNRRGRLQQYDVRPGYANQGRPEQTERDARHAAQRIDNKERAGQPMALGPARSRQRPEPYARMTPQPFRCHGPRIGNDVDR